MNQNRNSRTTVIQVFKREDKTYPPDELAENHRWSYYVSTFAMRDLTEGIPLSQLKWPFLKRNMPSIPSEDEDYANAYGSPQWNYDGLLIRIQPGSYKLEYKDADTNEWFVHNADIRKRGLGAYEEVGRERKEKFGRLFGERGSLLLESAGDEFEKEVEEYKRWIQYGPASAGKGGLDGADDADEVMGGT